jgi:hypothetical protein
MKPSDPGSTFCETPLPARLLVRLAGLPELFSRPTWCNAVLLLTGAILAPGKRTVTAALRILVLLSRKTAKSSGFLLAPTRVRFAISEDSNCPARVGWIVTM